MYEQRFFTLKEVAAHVKRPPHRIIHLCEIGVICPTIDAQGRGSVRRFSREDVLYVQLGLDLQDVGVSASLMKPLMARLQQLLGIKEIQVLKKRVSLFDLVSVIGLLGSPSDPVLAWLTPPTQIALVTPKLIPSSHKNPRFDLHANAATLAQRGVSVVANLSKVAGELEFLLA